MIEKLLFLWLFLHIAAAIVGFGPTFSFGLIMAMGAKDPKNMPFASAIMHAISKKVTLPLALSMAVTGTLLIIASPYGLSDTWLVAALGVYAVAISYSMFVQGPASGKMQEMIAGMPSGPPSGDAPAGPPAEMAKLGKKLQMGGMFLGVLTLVILVLMVWKPGA